MSEPTDEPPSESPPSALERQEPTREPRLSPAANLKRLLAGFRVRVAFGVSLAVVAIAVVVFLVVRARTPGSSNDTEPLGPGPLREPIAPCARSGGAKSSDTRVSAILERGPLAESLRNAGIAPDETYRVRRALEAIPGYLGGEPGRFVASRREDGVIEAFHLFAGSMRYAGRTDEGGRLLAERVTEPEVVRLCSGVIRLEEDLSESLVTSGFEPDLAGALRVALEGRGDVGTEMRGGELRIVVREILAVGDFAGYDGLEAISFRGPGGTDLFRLYAVEEPEPSVERRFVDQEGKALGATEASPLALATLKSRRGALDAALDAAVLSSAESVEAGEGGAASESAEIDAVDEPEPSLPRDSKRTVAQAMNASCSTRVVAGLSRQIIAEARCLNADAFTRIPPRKNLRASSNVFLFLEAPARDRLLRALDANPKRTMTINSALRTVAQQVLLSKWGETKRCGVRLAALPSESNHESGTALDVQEHAAWRKALEKEGFRWMGKKDPVHFDYVGPGAIDHRGLDVRAFQRLWNRNNKEDLVPESGKLDAVTHARLLKSPADGFPNGARSCP